MNLKEVLELPDTDISVKDKLEAIVATVNTARANYENTDMEIEIPEVQTTEGIVELSMVSNADKLALAKNALNTIRMQAYEDVKNHEGVNVNKAIEAMLATSPILTNLAKQATNEYGI